MIELLKIHALVRTARGLLVIASAADYVRKAACRKAEAMAIEAVGVMPGTRRGGGCGKNERDAKSP